MCIRDSRYTAVFAGFAPIADPRIVAAIVVQEPKIRLRYGAVSYTHLRAHETVLDLVCRLLLEKKKQKNNKYRGKVT